MSAKDKAIAQLWDLPVMGREEKCDDAEQQVEGYVLTRGSSWMAWSELQHQNYTKSTDLELCQVKSERKGGLTHKGLYLFWYSPPWDNSIFSKVLFFDSNLQYEANLIRLEVFGFWESKNSFYLFVTTSIINYDL